MLGRDKSAKANGGNVAAPAVVEVPRRSDVPVAFFRIPRPFPERGGDAAST